MAISKDDEMDENSETTIDETTPVVSRAQSNYSTQRTKSIIAPAKYGESRAQYLWRLLRCSIRRTIDAVSRADDAGRRRTINLQIAGQEWNDKVMSHIGEKE